MDYPLPTNPTTLTQHDNRRNRTERERNFNPLVGRIGWGVKLAAILMDHADGPSDMNTNQNNGPAWASEVEVHSADGEHVGSPLLSWTQK